MASGLFAFTKTPVPAEPRGPYRGGAITLKTFCWVELIATFVVAAFLVLGGLAFLFIGAIFGAVFDSIVQEWVPFGGTLLGGAVGLIVFVMMLVMAVFVLVVGLLFVWWGGWTYSRWVERDPRALTHALILGIVLTTLAGLNVLGTAGAALLDPLTLSGLVFGVLLIVFASKGDSKAAFTAPPPGPAAPPGPQGLP